MALNLLIFAAMKISLKIILGFVGFGLFLSSCTMERKLALQFIEGDAKTTSVMLVPPDILYMFNEKGLPYGHYDNIDSARFFSSKYIQHISDSTFLELYYKSFTSQAKEYGLEVYFPEAINEFLDTQTTSYIVRFAQMELMEDTAKYKVEEKVNFVNRIKEIEYNLVALSTWFEISMKDSAQSFTYFDEQFIVDEIYGDYYQEDWSFDYRYEYSQYELELENIYQFASDMGQTHASYVYDLMLNSYIWNQLPPEKRNNFNYLHYNVDYHSIEVVEEAFIMLDEDDK